MYNEKKQPNYTQVANAFIEQMHKYSGAEVKIMLAIFRKTIGWYKESDKIAYSQLTGMTGIISHHTIKYAIEHLQKDLWIIITGDEKRGYTYDLYLTDNNDVAKSATTKESIKEKERKENPSSRKHKARARLQQIYRQLGWYIDELRSKQYSKNCWDKTELSHLHNSYYVLGQTISGNNGIKCPDLKIYDDLIKRMIDNKKEAINKLPSVKEKKLEKEKERQQNLVNESDFRNFLDE